MTSAQTPNQASTNPAIGWVFDHGDALYRYALRRARNPEIAEDLVQDTLLAALACRDSFAGKSAERTWLIGILKHKMIDHLRNSIRQQPMSEAQSEGGFDPFDAHGHWKIRVSNWQCDPQQALENAEFQKVLASCLSKLPPRTARVFWLHEAERMSSKDLCKELELSPTNVWTMLHRARLGLQRCLSINWFEGGGR